MKALKIEPEGIEQKHIQLLHRPHLIFPWEGISLKELKDRGLWVYGTAADGSCDLWHTDLRGPAALVIGSEGDGMGRLVKESCDFIIRLPMKGKINSLNASAAAAITMYEVLRQRTENI